MSNKSKKDLRNGREEGRWWPQKWGEAKRALFTKHVKLHAITAIADGLPQFEGCNAALNLAAFLDSNASAHALQELGFKTLGETEAAK